jgi:hypothetical protein
MAAASWYCSDYVIPPGDYIGELLTAIENGLGNLGYTSVSSFPSPSPTGELYFNVTGWRGDFLIIASYWWLQSGDFGGAAGGAFGQSVYCFSGTATSSAETDAENGKVISMINAIAFL